MSRRVGECAGFVGRVTLEMAETCSARGPYVCEHPHATGETNKQHGDVGERGRHGSLELRQSGKGVR